MAVSRDEKIAIVGGGIAGLFCALVLNQQKKSFRLFEATERLVHRFHETNHMRRIQFC